MPVPQEILQLICKHMGRSDLKNARLACRELNNAAEISLFRQVLLRRNRESFRRLQMITSTPYIAMHVRAIAYSSRMLQEWPENTDFEEWRREHLGEGLFHPRGDVSELEQSCTMADMQCCYSNWCEHRHSQKLVDELDLEMKGLDAAFRELHQLDEIRFGHVKNYPPDSARPVRPELFSSLGREMMVEPDRINGISHHLGQFTAMMTAAHKSNKLLKRIKCFSLEWKVFEQQHEVLSMMIANMRNCEHFELIIWPKNRPESEKGQVQISSMMRNAPRLRTIILGFSTRKDEPLSKAIDLSRLFPPQSHWPRLRTLQLHGVKTSDIQLKAFLAAHASSLTILRLCYVHLSPYESKGRLHHGSWVATILFLHDALKLSEVSFSGFFTNSGNENWRVRGSTAAVGQDPLPTTETFKERVQRYVVDGGDFPLPRPIETEDEFRWQRVLRDFRAKLDNTWEYDEARSLRSYD